MEQEEKEEETKLEIEMNFKFNTRNERKTEINRLKWLGQIFMIQLLFGTRRRSCTRGRGLS